MTQKPVNPFEYSKDPELNRIFDSLVALRDKVATQFAKAEKIAGLGSVTGFVPVKDVKITMPNYRYERTRNNYTKTPLSAIEAMVRPAIDAARIEIESTAEENKAAEEQNRQLIVQITELMARIGIPGSYTTYDYPTARSKTKKTATHTAGYIGDLHRCCPKSNIQTARYALDNFIRDYESWLKTEKETELKEKIARDEAAVQKNILGNPALVATLMQAGVNILEEVQKAEPGKKAEIINYCKALAVSNIRAQVDVDHDLIERIIEL